MAHIGKSPSMSRSSSTETRRNSRINCNRSRSNQKKPRNGGRHSQPRLLLDDAIKDPENKANWSDARIKAYNNRLEKSNRNEFYYRFNAKWNEEKGDFDLEPTHTGRWNDSEHRLFMQRIKELGVNVNWGTFSEVIPGRCGYICSNYWKRMIKNGLVEDASYFWDNKKKKYSQYKIPKRYFNDYDLRYAFKVNEDASGIWGENLPTKHHRFPQNVQNIIEESKNRSNRSKRASNKKTTTTTNTNSKCDETEESEDVTGSESEIEQETETEQETEEEDIKGLRRSQRTLARRDINYGEPSTDIEDEEEEDEEEDEEDNDSVPNTNSSLSQLMVAKSMNIQYRGQKHDASDGDDENSDDQDSNNSSDSNILIITRPKKNNRFIANEEEEEEEKNDDIDTESEQQNSLSLQHDEQEGMVSMTVDRDNLEESDHETQRGYDEIVNSNNNNKEDIEIDERVRGRKRRREEVDDDDNNQDRLNKKRRLNDAMLTIQQIYDENDKENEERIKELEDEIKRKTKIEIEQNRKIEILHIKNMEQEMEMNDMKNDMKNELNLKNDRIIELENKLKQYMEREKENDLELKKFQNVKKDLKELNSYQFSKKYPGIYE